MFSSELGSQFHGGISLSGPTGLSRVLLLSLTLVFIYLRPAQDNQESIILHIFSTEEESDNDIKVCFSPKTLFEHFLAVCH